MGLFRKKQVNNDIVLSDGIIMKEPLQMETSSWLKNCMVKSLLVFSIVFGVLGCFLSSYDIAYMVVPTAVVLFLMALLFTSIYYRAWLMDAVYVVFFIIFVLLVRNFQIYINSGFYIIINAFLKEIETYFDLPGMQYYEIQADNDILSVTLVVIFVGTVMMIVSNVIISRTMNVWFMLIMTGWIWMIPLYFRLEPDSFYIVLMVTGYMSVWAVHSSGAFGMDRKHRDYKWKDKKGKGLKFWYMQDAATLLETLALFIVMIILMYGVTSMVQDKDTFTWRFNQNPRKEESEQILQDIATKGTSIFNRYSATGGISDGQLGGVGSVNFDYQTDLIVTFAPYSYEPVYLKAFTGVDYDSAESCWMQIPSFDNYPYAYFSTVFENEDTRLAHETGKEAEILAENYLENNGETSARAIMLIQNVGANVDHAYAPYYAGEGDSLTGFTLTGAELGKHVVRGNSDLIYTLFDILEGEIGTGQTAEYEFYPLVGEVPEGYQVSEELERQAERFYCSVPEECREAVAKACDEAGIEEGDSEEVIVAKVQNYLETEFSYTTRPGRTPRGEDFITHFLETRKGYCAHFSSAATMMLRYSGVPARYIEGYVITFDEIMTSDLNEEYSYEDFYNGYNLLGETAVVDVEVSDARAHAWVEYFDENFGWRQIEVTTAAVDPEEEQDSFWDIFDAERDSDDDNTLGNGLNIQPVDLNLDDLKGIWIALLIVIMLLLLVYAGQKGYRSYKVYQSWHTEDKQENVLAYYHIISERLRKKEPAYQQCPTYRRQLNYLQRHCKEWKWDADQIADLLEQAGYSRNGIKEFDCKRLMIELADIEKKVKKWKKYRM